MKKVKTILLSLVIMLASAFFSACSCGGSDVEQVLDTGISIRCVTDSVESTLDEESGLLEIHINRGEKFTIEYTLSPDNVTLTQVDWVVKDISVAKSKVYTYSKSNKETITFDAVAKGETEIVFTTRTSKTAVAKVYVYEALASLPTFATPASITYDANTGNVQWSAVSHFTNGSAVEKDGGGKIVGLACYKLDVKEYNDAGAVINTQTYETSMLQQKLDTGKRYGVSVTAIGDNQYNAKDSAPSEEYKFMQVATVTDLANNNGTISFTMPNNATIADVYYSDDDTSRKNRITGNANEKMSMPYTNIVSEYDADTMPEFNFSIQAFPFGYVSEKGYSENDSLGFKIYPSTKSEAIDVYKLVIPQVSVENIVKQALVGKVSTETNAAQYSFDDVNSESAIKVLIPEGHGSNYGPLAVTCNYTITYPNGTKSNLYTNPFNLNNFAFADISNKDWQSKAGTYALDIYFAGDPATTIQSELKQVTFYQLPVLNSSTGVYTDEDVITITSNDGAEAVELYFVDNSNPENKFYRYIELDGTDADFTVSNVTDGISAPGVYRVYARLIGQEYEDITDVLSNIALTGGVLQSYDDCLSQDIQIFPAPSEVKIQSDGIVTFKLAAQDADTYLAKLLFKGTDDTAGISADVELSLNAEESIADLICPYIELDGYGSFDVYQAIRIALQNGNIQNVPDGEYEFNEWFKLYFREDSQVRLQIVTKGMGTGVDTYTISSSPTRLKTTSRYAGINDLVLFRNNNKEYFEITLSEDVDFDNYRTASFVFEVDGRTFIADTASEKEVKDGYFVINMSAINTEKLSGETTAPTLSLLDAINACIAKKSTDASVYNFLIKTYIVGQDTTDNGSGILNSNVAEKYFDFTGTPFNLAMDTAGNLYWDTQCYDLESSSWIKKDFNSQDAFIINFYDSEGNFLEQLSYSAVAVMEETPEEEPEAPEEETPVTPSIDATYKENISHILDKYKGQLLQIKITQTYTSVGAAVMGDQFYGPESGVYYAQRLATVSVVRKTEGDTSVIEWSEVEGADKYIITCSSEIFIKQVDGEDTPTDTLTLIGKTNTKYNVPASLDLGDYEFTVIASYENSGVNSENNPFTLESLSTDILDGDGAIVSSPNTTLKVVNGNILVYAEGENVTWEHINGAEYQVRYQKNGTTAWTTVDAEDITTSYEQMKVYFDGTTFEEGRYNVEVIPVVSYANTGIMIRRTNEFTAPIFRINQVTNLTTTTGKITFTYTPNTDNTSLKLYTKTGENYTEIPKEMYSLTNEESSYVIDTHGIIPGTYTFAVQAVATGMLDGAIVDAQAPFTKVATITDFEKIGSYLYWTPVELDSTYANEYIIRVNKAGAEVEKMYLKVTKSGTSYECLIGTADDNGEITYNTTADFSYDSTLGKFKLLFIMAFDAEPGDYSYSIKPIILATNYLNGDYSGSTIITKLNSDVTIAISDGKINISNYVADGTGLPETVEVLVQRFKIEIVETPSEEPDGEPTREETYVEDTTAKIVYSVATNNAIPFANFNTDGGYVIDLNDYPEMLGNGAYKVTVKFIGDGNSVIDSIDKVGDNLEKLSATTFEMKDGALTLSSVTTNASTYGVKIVDESGNIVATFDFTPEEDSLSLPDVLAENGTTITNFALGGASVMNDGEVLDEGDGSEEPTEPEEPVVTDILSANTLYTIYVQSKADTYLNSKWSVGFNFKKLSAPTNVYIDKAGTVLVVDGKKLETGVPALFWTNPNAEVSTEDGGTSGVIDNTPNGYAIKYSEDEVYSYLGNLIYWELKSDLPLGTYGIQLRVVGNSTAGTGVTGLLSSNYSVANDKTTVQFIANDTAPKITNGVVSWTGLNGAEAYKVTGTLSTDNSITFTTYVTATELDIVSNKIETFENGGYWDISVEPLTDPSQTIVSNHEDVEHSGTMSVYKPHQAKNYKVLDGMLSWEYSIADVMDYISSQELEEAPTQADVITYVKDMINIGESEVELGVDVSYLYNLTFNINKVVTQDTPTKIIVLDNLGKEITTEDDYDSAVTLRFAYDVSIQTDFDSSTADKWVTNTAGIEYRAGFYTISLSLGGNKGDILSSSYTRDLTAYKPNTPRSWYEPVELEKEDGASVQEVTGEPTQPETELVYTDILKGRALWELSVVNAQVKNEISGAYQDVISYYPDYSITAKSDIGEGSVAIDLSIDIENDTNIKDSYKFSKDLKELFHNEKFGNVAGEKEYLVNLNEFYRLFIHTKGTVDSTLLEEGEYVYLNSNTYEYSNKINILDIDDPAVQNSTLSWQTSTGSTATEVYIYGPINQYGNTVDTEKGWETKLEAIYELAKLRYLAEDEAAFETIPDTINTSKFGAPTTDTFKAELARVINELKQKAEQDKILLQNKIHRHNFASEKGDRDTFYNLNDNEIYATGGYAIYSKEIGDGKGIIDSPKSNIIFAYKLDTVTKCVTNNADDNWLGSGDTQGMFEWDPVPQANAYKVYVYERTETENPDDPSSPIVSEKRLYETMVYNATHYEMDSKDIYNKDGSKYFLHIVACNVTRAESGAFVISDNYFNSDTMIMDEAYYRISIPEAIVVNDMGEITWNEGATNNRINNFYVKLNYYPQASTNIATDNNTPLAKIPDYALGTISIGVKAIATLASEYLNSSYSAEFYVTRLADPNPRVDDGVFTWSTEGGEQMEMEVTKTLFTVDDGTSITLNNDEISYAYNTEMTSYNSKYTLAKDLAKYPEGLHKFSTKFLGTTGNSAQVAEGRFLLSSQTIDYYVNKLTAPVIENVIDNNVTKENQVRWEEIPNSTGYRVVVFYDSYDEDADIEKYEYIIQEIAGKWYVTVVTPTKTNVEEINKADNPYFAFGSVVENGDTIKYVYYKLTNLINMITEAGDTDGYSLTIYTQALGDIDADNGFGTLDNPGYINSSYSDVLVAAVPATPTNAVYNPTTGVLSWSVEEANKYNFNIVLAAEYQVAGVTAEELVYWKKSANKIQENVKIDNITSWLDVQNNESFDASIVGFDNIGSRYLLVEGNSAPYRIKVRDTMLLEDVDGLTPTHYSLTAVGTDYEFELTTTAYTSIDTSGDATTGLTYKSPTFFFEPKNSRDFTSLFVSGNGSEALPYQVNSEVGFNAIRYFADRHFVITSDIKITGDWDPITTAINYSATINAGNEYSIDNKQVAYTFNGIFTGSIDGLNHTIYGLTKTGGSNIAIMEENAGMIKNLNLQVDFAVTSGNPSYLRMAGVAITNSGTISNVHIGEYTEESTVYTSSLIINGPNSTVTSRASRVGGLVVTNTGTIENSSVNASIKAIDATTSTTYAGGIAATMSGENANITNTYFTGTIEGNYVAGIVVQITETGKVSRCYVADGTTITGADTTSKNSTRYKALAVAGIVTVVSNAQDITIEKSYSLANLVSKKATNNISGQANVGGIAALINVATNGSAVVSDVYVVVNFSYTGNGNNVNHVSLAVSPVSATNSYYIVESNTLPTSDAVASVGSVKLSLADLKLVVDTNVYDTTTEYPTLKPIV